MSCELYNMLTDNSILSGTGPSCKDEGFCPKTAKECRWGPMLRRVARNMSLEDTPEDLEQDAILAELELKTEHEALLQAIKSNSQIKSLISISRVN